MSFQALQNILGYNTLTGLIRTTTDGIPKVLPDGFYQSGQKVIGKTGTYTTVKGQRKLARVMVENSLPTATAMEEIGIRPFKVISLGEPKTFPVNEMLLALRKYTSYDPQKIGDDEFLRQIALFKRKFDNTKTAAIMMVLASGTISWDSQGRILPNSSGAIYTYDAAIPSANKDQLDIDGNGDIIDAPWSSPETDIPKCLRTLKQRATFQHGYEPNVCVYGKNVPSYMVQNAYVLDYLARTPNMSGTYLSDNEIPDGLFGFKWIPGYKSFFESESSGANNTLVADDKVIFFPEKTTDWYELVEGSQAIPTSINIQPNLDSMLGNLQEIHGDWAYGYLKPNPLPEIIVCAGSNFAPIVKIPEVLYQGTVVF